MVTPVLVGLPTSGAEITHFAPLPTLCLEVSLLGWFGVCGHCTLHGRIHACGKLSKPFLMGGDLLSAMYRFKEPDLLSPVHLDNDIEATF